MSSIAIAMMVLASVLGALALGIWLNAALPGHHLTAESRDSLKASIAVVSTLTALVLGLLVATAKSSYDAKSDGLTRATVDIILLDRVLARYGPEAAPARNMLREATISRLNALWSETGFQRSKIDSEGAAVVGQLDRMVRELKPESDDQRAIRSQAHALTVELARTLMLTLARAGGTIPAAFLFVLGAWLVIIFASIGLLTPCNATAVTAVVASAFAFSAAVFLILELDTPYGGLIQLSDAPARLALEHLGR
jgi:hypothetical protein